MVAEGKADLAVDAAAGVGEKQESEQAQGPKGKVLVLQADIPEDLQEKAIEKAGEALAAHTVEKDVASAIKKYFDATYGGSWHCIAGNSFGCSVTHETKFLFFFKYNHTYLLLFKSQDE